MEIAVATERGSGSISSILETLPGLANVLRSPVADAMVGLARAAAGVGTFQPKDAQELIRYAVRRGLISGEEGDRVLAEVDGGVQRRVARAASRKAARAARAKAASGKKAGAAAKQTRRASSRRASRSVGRENGARRTSAVRRPSSARRAARSTKKGTRRS
jgi:hypothetical protein